MKTALVTGASGMLGAQIVQRLSGNNWNVRALVRDAGASQWIEGLGADLHRGDLTDRMSVLRAAQGCDVIFHAGAAIGSGGAWDAYRAANVAGTAHVLEAGSAGARVVYVSSTAVYGRHRYQPRLTDETLPLPELPARDTYGRSKQEAERLVADAHRRRRVWATIVRPPVMYGPRDRQFVPRIGPVFLRGFFPLVNGGDTRLPLVSASAVAEGAVLASEFEGANGRVYLLTNDTPVTVADLAAFAAEGLGRRVRMPYLSLAAGQSAFGVLKAALLLAGRIDLAAHVAGTFHMLTRNNPFTSRRACLELGWAPSTVPSQIIPEAFRSWMAWHTESARG